MNKLIIAAIFALTATASFADTIDDRVAKAEKGVISATKRLDAAKACQADKVACLTKEQDAQQKSADRATKKLNATKEALASVTQQ